MGTPKQSQDLPLWEAFASLHRLRILRLLMEEEVCQRDFKVLFGWPQSTAARHLLYLKEKGLIKSRKDGLWRYYRLETGAGRLKKLLLKALREGMMENAVLKEDLKNLKRLQGRLKKVERKKYARRRD